MNIQRPVNCQISAEITITAYIQFFDGFVCQYLLSYYYILPLLYCNQFHYLLLNHYDLSEANRDLDLVLLCSHLDKLKIQPNEYITLPPHF